LQLEYASQRKIRERNKLYYRVNHWPIWIFVFFIAPGPLTFDLFERGFDSRMALWLGAVLVGTAVAGLRGALPGVEPRPYIIRFTEDRPNPLYRRVCYTFAWSEVITFAVLNATGLVIAIVTGQWYLKQIYQVAYFPLAGSIWLLGALGKLPRVKPSTRARVTSAAFLRIRLGRVLGAAVLWLMWRVLPRSPAFDLPQAGSLRRHLAFVGHQARLGRLPRTRPIVPGSSRCRTEPSEYLVSWLSGYPTKTHGRLRVLRVFVVPQYRRRIWPCRNRAGRDGTSTRPSTTGKMRGRSVARMYRSGSAWLARREAQRSSLAVEPDGSRFRWRGRASHSSGSIGPRPCSTARPRARGPCGPAASGTRAGV
jgi:hypothetical protein